MGSRRNSEGSLPAVEKVTQSSSVGEHDDSDGVGIVLRDTNELDSLGDDMRKHTHGRVEKGVRHL